MEGEMKRMEMQAGIIYIICPKKKCRLFRDAKGHCPCDGHCPHQDKLKLVIICNTCGKIIVLSDNRFRIDCECGAMNFRPKERYQFLNKMPKR